MSITPLILGSGHSGQAIAKSLSIISLMRPELNIATPIWLKRGALLSDERQKYKQAVLCISNPHALHSSAIIEADLANYNAILCEKPACVNIDQLQSLRAIKTPTAILQIFRQTWGLQTLKQMMLENSFGELITVEGRYWQSSSAERALFKNNSNKSWKDDPLLSGEFDTYLDLGVHWIDAVSFLLGVAPTQINASRSFANAHVPHRESHIQMNIEFLNITNAFGSISKTFHGANNHFEINLLGSKMSATWNFLRPDEIIIGEGRDIRVLTRKDSKLGSKQSPFHGMGWLEGYIEITSQLFTEVFEGQSAVYPRLSENLNVMESMLKVRWQ